jgi:hypothetical protein
VPASRRGSETAPANLAIRSRLLVWSRRVYEAARGLSVTSATPGVRSEPDDSTATDGAATFEVSRATGSEASSTAKTPRTPSKHPAPTSNRPWVVDIALRCSRGWQSLSASNVCFGRRPGFPGGHRKQTLAGRAISLKVSFLAPPRTHTGGHDQPHSFATRSSRSIDQPGSLRGGACLYGHSAYTTNRTVTFCHTARSRRLGRCDRRQATSVVEIAVDRNHPVRRSVR